MRTHYNLFDTKNIYTLTLVVYRTTMTNFKYALLTTSFKMKLEIHFLQILTLPLSLSHASLPNDSTVTFFDDLLVFKNPPKSPDREAKDEGQCSLPPPVGQGVWGIFPSVQQLVCVSQWQLDGITSRSNAYPPHYSVMALQWVNIEL